MILVKETDLPQKGNLVKIVGFFDYFVVLQFKYRAAFQRVFFALHVIRRSCLGIAQCAGECVFYYYRIACIDGVRHRIGQVRR